MQSEKSWEEGNEENGCPGRTGGPGTSKYVYHTVDFSCATFFVYESDPYSLL